MTHPDPLWGPTTVLAIENFAVSGEPVPVRVIRALALIKREAAKLNGDHGLDRDVATAIAAAADAVLDGAHDDQFPVDVFQTGSGTSTNMNVNEVLATLASRELGRPVHPNDEVNASQSSNDTFPAAIRLAAADAVTTELVPSLGRLEVALRERAAAFDEVVKAGRTHLADATPVTVGQEFAGYAAQVSEAITRLQECLGRVGRLPLGGTATGTGLNAPPTFGADIAARLAQVTGLDLREAPDHFAVQGSQDALVELSAQLRGAAVALYKIAADIRLMASGPRTGLGELTLPALQPGSSIMPGKVNPIMAEVVTQVGAQVIGNDAAIAFAGTQGVLELNTYLPLIARNLMSSIGLLDRAAALFAERCVAGIEVDEGRCRFFAEATPAIATVLAPVLGYDVVAEVVTESLRGDRTIAQIVSDRGLLPAAELDRLLDPLAMAHPHRTG